MKLSNSCRVAFGKNSLIGQFAAGVIVAAVMLVGALVKYLWQNDSVQDFIEGFCITFCGITMIFLAIFMLGGAFSMVTAASPGFKYFRFLANGDKHFRNCLISANLAGLFCLGLYALIGALFYEVELWNYIVFAGLFCMSWQNLTGGARSVWMKIVSFMGIGFAMGFIPGFFNDDEFERSSFVMAICAGVCAVFYIISFVIMLYNAKKLWRREA